MLMYGRNQHKIVIILQFKINKEKNAHKFGPGIPFLKINRKDTSGQRYMSNDIYCCLIFDSENRKPLNGFAW